MKQLHFLTLLILNVFFTFSQDFGGHPNNIQWKQINNENARVIYPDGNKEYAERIANTIDYINNNNLSSIGEKSRKIDIILQTNQVISNGYVGLAPYRSEFFATGMQNQNRIGSSDWLDLLAIHEYRHTLQYNNGNRGVTKFLHLISGEMGWGLGLNLSLPNWYFEGDAVLSETLLTNSGRGRTPSFLKEIKANTLNNKNYSYETLRNGSFFKQLPNHYPFGHTICNYTRNKYGNSVWKNILKDAGAYNNLFYPFRNAMVSHTNETPTSAYKNSFTELKNNWTKEINGLIINEGNNITTKPKRTVTNYRFPSVLKNGNIVAIKNSYKTIPSIVEIHNGHEKKLSDYGFTQETFLSENNGILAWTELQLDPRRGNRNYTKIVTYNTNTGEKRYVNSKSKYFSPQVSEDGNKIIVVEANENLKNRLTILDSKTGEVIKEISNSKNLFLSYPKWINSQEVIYLAKEKSKLALFKINTQTNIIERLTKWTYHTIGAFNVSDNNVYFSSSFSGTDNIYRVNINTPEEIKQITSVRVGAYEPTINTEESKLVYSKFTDMGYQLSEIDIKNNYSNFTFKEPHLQERYNIKTTEFEYNILDSISNRTYDENDFKGLFRGMKVHSWGMYFENNEHPGAYLSMTNLMNNFNGSLSTFYNNNSESLNYTADISYGKWYPEFHIKPTIINNKYPLQFENGSATLKSSELNLASSIEVPLSWLKGNYSISLLPIINFNNYFLNKKYFNPNHLFSLAPQLNFSVFKRTAYQNLLPRLGFSLSAIKESSLNNKSDKDFYFNRTSIQGNIYLPGILSNHSINLRIGYQNDDLNKFSYKPYSDTFVYSRGYNNTPNTVAKALSFNYHLPITYPDFGIAGITYFKRIRANLFYDYSSLDYFQFKKFTNQNSYGAELIFDNTYLNVLPISIGLRQTYLIDKDSTAPDRTNLFEVFFAIPL